MPRRRSSGPRCPVDNRNQAAAAPPPGPIDPCPFSRRRPSRPRRAPAPPARGPQATPPAPPAQGAEGRADGRHAAAAAAAQAAAAPARRSERERRCPPVYGRDLGNAQLKRLLWRAGFGPKPGDVDALSGKPLQDVVHSLTRPSGSATLDRARAGRQRRAARARRLLGRRPPVVARPDGALGPAARRAHDADLARLVRDVERGRRQPAADARPERSCSGRARSARSATCCWA